MAKPVDFLENDTIIEAIAEFRFAKGRDDTATILPGILFSTFKDYFQKVTDLPASKIPAEFLESQVELEYSPFRLLEGKGGNRLLVGPKTVSVAVARPYPGWPKWAPWISECLKVCMDAGVLGEPQRLSLKYANLLDVGSNESDLTQLTARLELPGLAVRGTGLQFRAEVDHGGCVNIVSIASATTVTVPSAGYTSQGVLVTVDAIKEGPLPDLRARIDELLAEVHAAGKDVFFAMLEESTVEKLNSKRAGA